MFIDEKGLPLRRVCIIQPVMKRYRLPFFVGLRNQLAEQGVKLAVVYGTPWASEASRGDHCDLPTDFGYKVKNHIIFRKLFFQPVWKAWWQADLVIVEQANKHVLNYLLLLLCWCRVKRVAFWGHGRDFQADSDSLAERLKRKMARWVDWWFAYTSGVAKYLEEVGFPPSKVTAVENAVDTEALRTNVAKVSAEELALIREELGLSQRDRVVVFCGSLYKNKCLDFLLGSGTKMHQQLEHFRLVVIGDGPLRKEISSFSKDHHWVKYVGAKFGSDKARYLRLAELWLNPGAVGLGILDAFSASLPLVTTALTARNPDVEYMAHGPEIQYLEHGYNGLMLPYDKEIFASSVVSVLKDAERLATMREGACESGKRYTVDNMVHNFSKGIMQCLARS